MTTSLTRVQEVESIAPLFERAKAAQIQADAARKQLAIAMLEWLREQLPAGTVVDLRHNKSNPLWRRARI